MRQILGINVTPKEPRLYYSCGTKSLGIQSEIAFSLFHPSYEELSCCNGCFGMIHKVSSTHYNNRGILKTKWNYCNGQIEDIDSSKLELTDKLRNLIGLRMGFLSAHNRQSVRWEVEVSCGSKFILESKGWQDHNTLLLVEVYPCEKNKSKR